ncbi:Araf43A, partial [Symbiodinium necroappetens]
MAAAAAAAVGAVEVHEDFFANPIVDGDYPDPGAAWIGDRYYLVATGGGPQGAFRMLQSSDLVHWESCGQVFSSKSLPVWSGGAHGEKCDYWAPEIHQLPSGRKAVFFSAREPAPGRALHIGVATSDKAEGPYQDIGEPLVSDPHWAIDATYFNDHESGKQYLLWKIDGNAHNVPSAIKIRELDTTAGCTLATGSEVHELIRNDLPWEGTVVEGPFLIKRGGFYYLFYSGECYGNHRYCVGVARAEQVLGPYEKAAAPVLSSGRGFAGPGHCVVVAAPGGDVMVYHAWPSESPGGRGSRGAKRQVLAERVTWEDGWPCVGCGVPTTGPQPSPHQRAEPKRLLVPGKVYRLKASQDWGVYLGYEGKLTKSKDEAYVVRSGLKPGGTVSLEAASRPGHFLRHRCGKL